MTRPVRPRSGFSLLELLVVIGIIAIVLAILLPVLTKVRTAASKPICMSNLRQAGMLLHAYAKDNGDELPSVYTPRGLSRSDEPKRVTAWIGVVVPRDGGIGLLMGAPIGFAPKAYVHSARIFICPSQPLIQRKLQGSDDFIGSLDDDDNGKDIDLGEMSYSYAYVPKGGDFQGTDRYVDGLALQGWHPGALAGLERHSVSQPKGASTAIMIERYLAVAADTDAVKKRVQHHEGGANVLYLDGHVGWVEYGQMRRHLQDSASGIQDRRRFLAGVDRAGN